MIRFVRYMTTPLLSLVVATAILACMGESNRTTPAPLPNGEDSGTLGDGGGYNNPDTQEPHPEIPPSERCDDDDPCTFADRLVDGVCIGTPYDCDDGKACTQGECDGVGGCLYTLHSGFCLHHGVCVMDGQSPEHNPCLLCDASQDPYSLVTIDNDTDCNLHNACLIEGRCEDGVCIGESVDCDDGNICTTNWCDPDLGCMGEPNRLDCNDGDACTVGDFCLDGACQPGPVMLTCNDENPCTLNNCDPGQGCLFTPLPDGTACDNGNACSVGDTCQNDLCEPGPPVVCDDGNSCTLASCDPHSGCQFLLDADNPCCTTGVNPCDDGNPCTTDICDPIDFSCTNEPRQGPCNNGDACTVGDMCVDVICEAGEPLVCDDGNMCTVNLCDSAIGCVTTVLPDETDCDDGDPCTVADRCIGGACRSGDRLSCSDCPPPFWNPMNLTVELVIGSDGHPGSGLDVDNDATTCSPAADCSAGIDNQFSEALATLGPIIDVNVELANAVQSGAVSVLLEHRSPNQTGAPYTLGVYPGTRLASTCDPNNALCEYHVEESGLVYEQDCQALILFDDTRIIPGGTRDGRLTAGGPGSRFSLSLPLLEGIMLSLTLYHARIEADVVVADGIVTDLENGIIGGAVRQQEVLDLVEELPDEMFSSLPGGKGLVLSLIPLLFVSDIDTSGDGTMDATSMGLLFTARSAIVSGVSPSRE